MNALNRPEEKVDVYKPFPGANTTQMAKLLAEGREPISILGIWERRVAVNNDPEPLRTAWQENYFDSGDGIAYNVDGELKFVRDAPPLRAMTKKSTLRSGALIITPEAYAAQQGLAFSNAERNEFNLYTAGNPVRLTENDAQTGTSAQARALRYLLRADEDPKRAEQVIADTYRIAKDRYQLIEIAGFYIAPAPAESPVMRAWYANRVNLGAVLGGDANLDDVGRFVGVAPTAQCREQRRSAATLDANIQRAHSLPVSSLPTTA